MLEFHESAITKPLPITSYFPDETEIFKSNFPPIHFSLSYYKTPRISTGHFEKCWERSFIAPESNLEPSGYEPDVLTTELKIHKKGVFFHRKLPPIFQHSSFISFYFFYV